MIPDVTKLDVASAHTYLHQMLRLVEPFQNAKTVLDVLMNKNQVAAELDAAIAAKRLELDTMEKKATDEASARAEAKAKAIGKAIMDQLEIDEKSKKDRIAALEQKIGERRTELEQVEAQLKDLQGRAKVIGNFTGSKAPA